MVNLGKLCQTMASSCRIHRKLLDAIIINSGSPLAHRLHCQKCLRAKKILFKVMVMGVHRLKSYAYLKTKYGQDKNELLEAVNKFYQYLASEGLQVKFYFELKIAAQKKEKPEDILCMLMTVDDWGYIKIAPDPESDNFFNLYNPSIIFVLRWKTQVRQLIDQFYELKNWHSKETVLGEIANIIGYKGKGPILQKLSQAVPRLELVELVPKPEPTGPEVQNEFTPAPRMELLPCSSSESQANLGEFHQATSVALSGKPIKGPSDPHLPSGFKILLEIGKSKYGFTEVVPYNFETDQTLAQIFEFWPACEKHILVFDGVDTGIGFVSYTRSMNMESLRGEVKAETNTFREFWLNEKPSEIVNEVKNWSPCQDFSGNYFLNRALKSGQKKHENRESKCPQKCPIFPKNCPTFKKNISMSNAVPP